MSKDDAIEVEALRRRLAGSPREVLRLICGVLADVAAHEHAAGEEAALARIEVFERRLALLQAASQQVFAT